MIVRASTNFTLFFKIFLPTFWLSFVLPLCMFYLYSIRFGGVGLVHFIVVFILLTGFAAYWLFLRTLKRVDLDAEFLYVSNYFNTIRIPHKSIKKISEASALLFKKFIVELNEPGRFGNRIAFYESGQNFQKFISEHPEVFGHLLDEE